MKKPIYNSTGTKQIVNTGWKLFDRQTNCITKGNVYANTQYSGCIRPWKETECNGRTNPEGHLTNFDIEPFRKFRIPTEILNKLLDHDREKGLILYMFFTINGYGRIEPFYWALTDYDYKLVEDKIVIHTYENFEKRVAAKNEILQYITV